MSPFESIPISPFCVHLRSKKLILSTHPPRVEEEILDPSGHTWCDRTQEAVGPDDEIVQPELCCKGRACFKAYSGS